MDTTTSRRHLHVVEDMVVRLWLDGRAFSGRPATAGSEYSKTGMAWKPSWVGIAFVRSSTVSVAKPLLGIKGILTTCARHSEEGSPTPPVTGLRIKRTVLSRHLLRAPHL